MEGFLLALCFLSLYWWLSLASVSSAATSLTNEVTPYATAGTCTTAPRRNWIEVAAGVTGDNSGVSVLSATTQRSYFEFNAVCFASNFAVFNC